MMQQISFVELRTCGFLHPGKERWKRVTKRCWDVLPGSLLYGAVSAALIKTECIKVEATPARCTDCLRERTTCGFRELLQNVPERHIRFSPLIPCRETVEDAVGYCRAGLSLLKGDRQPRSPALGTTPHAPLNRQRMMIHEDLLHGSVCHQPWQRYAGFVLHDDTFAEKLRKALRVLPILPVGGRGKFTFVEGQVNKTISRQEFETSFRDHTTSLLRMLTPLIVGDGARLLAERAAYHDLAFQRYQVWRTGPYWEQDKWTPYEVGQRERSPAALGLLEGSMVRLKEELDVHERVRLFLEGFGHQDWTYLGWGQVIFDDDTALSTTG